MVEPTPLKNDGVKVSWDSVIPNMWKNKNVPNHQSDGDLAHGRTDACQCSIGQNQKCHTKKQCFAQSEGVKHFLMCQVTNSPIQQVMCIEEI